MPDSVPSPARFVCSAKRPEWPLVITNAHVWPMSEPACGGKVIVPVVQRRTAFLTNAITAQRPNGKDDGCDERDGKSAGVLSSGFYLSNQVLVVVSAVVLLVHGQTHPHEPFQPSYRRLVVNQFVAIVELQIQYVEKGCARAEPWRNPSQSRQGLCISLKINAQAKLDLPRIVGLRGNHSKGLRTL